jgi:hypothetical protein
MYISVEKTFELPHGTLKVETRDGTKILVLSNPNFPNQFQVKTIVQISPEFNQTTGEFMLKFPGTRRPSKIHKAFIVQSNGDHTGELIQFTNFKDSTYGVHFRVNTLKGIWHGRLVGYLTPESTPDLFRFFQFNIAEGEEVEL